MNLNSYENIYIFSIPRLQEKRSKLRTMNKSSINKTYHIFFTSLANPLRMDIITSLKQNKEGLSVSELASNLWINQSKLSHALAGLRKCNIVLVKQSGKKRIYSLNTSTILPILEIIDNHSKINCGGNCRYCKNC